MDKFDPTIFRKALEFLDKEGWHEVRFHTAKEFIEQFGWRVEPDGDPYLTAGKMVQLWAIYRPNGNKANLMAQDDTVQQRALQVAREYVARHGPALLTENAAMRSIVAAVAKMNGVTTDETSCVFCGVIHLWETFEHAPDCPAVAAVRLMEGMKDG